jgi:hypothetical protein
MNKRCERRLANLEFGSLARCADHPEVRIAQHSYATPTTSVYYRCYSLNMQSSGIRSKAC